MGGSQRGCVVLAAAVTFAASALTCQPASIAAATDSGSHGSAGEKPAFGPSSLDFEIVYFVTSPDYVVFMDTQQRVNLEVLRQLEKVIDNP